MHLRETTQKISSSTYEWGTWHLEIIHAYFAPDDTNFLTDWAKIIVLYFYYAKLVSKPP